MTKKQKATAPKAKPEAAVKEKQMEVFKENLAKHKEQKPKVDQLEQLVKNSKRIVQLKNEIVQCNKTIANATSKVQNSQMVVKAIYDNELNEARLKNKEQFTIKEVEAIEKVYAERKVIKANQRTISDKKATIEKNNAELLKLGDFAVKPDYLDQIEAMRKELL